MSLSCNEAQKELARLKKRFMLFKDELEEFSKHGPNESVMANLRDLKLNLSRESGKLREQLTTTPYQEAKEIFEEEFFIGYKVARDLFDVMTPDTNEPIPFARHELMEAKEQGKILIYRPLGMHRIQDICRRFLNRSNPSPNHHMDGIFATMIATQYVKYAEEANKRWQRSDFLTPGWSIVDTSELDEKKTVRSMGFDRPRMVDMVYDIIASRLVYGSLMNRGPIVSRDREVEQNGRIAGYDSIQIFENTIDMGVEFSLVPLDEEAQYYSSKNR
ncbi:hypothetical protein IT407_04940 [Candidatus Uhrbacteria bacterium]|nr:hypothetical protein [Candidatus Uhrbacteria bacterium]